VTLKARFPEWAEPIFQPVRYKVMYGGRGAGRSWTCAQALLIRGAQEKLRILCVREFQKSISDSVYRLLVDMIQRLKIPGYRTTKTTIEHVGTGTNFIFEGLRYNSNRIKSFEGVDICWVEEAEAVSKDSWEILIPTIRKEYSEIWITFNPAEEDDPTYQRFVVEPPHNAWVTKIGWEDNPWFPETLREEKDYLYRVDPDAAEHVWGGFPRKHTDAQVLKHKYTVQVLDPKEEGFYGPFYGLDFGFNDPTAATESWTKPYQGRSNGFLYVSKEMFRPNLDIHMIRREMAKAFHSRIAQEVIRADSSRPETISFLKKKGMFRIQPVFKWPGSVEDGIAWLRSFEKIIVHPDCKNLLQEFKLYSYKVDPKTEEVTDKLVDKHNHGVDSLRYAHTPKIRARRKQPSGTYAGITYAPDL